MMIFNLNDSFYFIVFLFFVYLDMYVFVNTD